MGFVHITSVDIPMTYKILIVDFFTRFTHIRNNPIRIKIKAYFVGSTRQFSEAVNLSKGPHKNHVACNMPKRIANKENSDRIKDFMEQNPTLSIRRAENDLEIPRATVGFYTYIDLILNFPP